MKVASRNIYADVPIPSAPRITRRTLVAVRGQAVPPEYRDYVDAGDLVDEDALETQPLAGTIQRTVTSAAARDASPGDGTDGDTPPPDDETPPAPEDLAKVKREDLDARAKKAGVKEPEKLANKGEVIAAIADKVAGEDLGDLDRDALNKRAAAAGVSEPEKLATKPDVVAAIAARSEQ